MVMTLVIVGLLIIIGGLWLLSRSRSEEASVQSYRSPDPLPSRWETPPMPVYQPSPSPVATGVGTALATGVGVGVGVAAGLAISRALEDDHPRHHTVVHDFGDSDEAVVSVPLATSSMKNFDGDDMVSKDYRAASPSDYQKARMSLIDEPVETVSHVSHVEAAPASHYNAPVAEPEYDNSPIGDVSADVGADTSSTDSDND